MIRYLVICCILLFAVIGSKVYLALTQQQNLKIIDSKQNSANKPIIIAVIDTGMDIEHKDLKNNLWTNNNEIPDNGIDDDNNGFVDDINGWNFVSDNNKLTDNHGHGTHISGIIVDSVNSKGAGSNVKIMVLKYFDPRVPKGDNLANTIKCIEYAIKMGADVINYSGGGIEFSAKEYAAVKLAQAYNIPFIAAAGNERSNSDYHKYFPANYELSNIVSVTAVNPRGDVLLSSNFGVKTVDVGAPGQNILSTLPNNQYGYMTGTSQATAFVTSAFAILKDRFPNVSNDNIVKAIKNSCNVSKKLKRKISSGGVISVDNAIKYIEANGRM